MDSSTALSDPHRIARAFLALGDDLEPPPVQHSPGRAVAALAAALALALAAPLTWLTPPATPGAKVTEQPTATLASSKAVLAADDEDDADD
jgi:hypothetical protein